MGGGGGGGGGGGMEDAPGDKRLVLLTEIHNSF